METTISTLPKYVTITYEVNRATGYYVRGNNQHSFTPPELKSELGTPRRTPTDTKYLLRCTPGEKNTTGKVYTHLHPLPREGWYIGNLQTEYFGKKIRTLILYYFGINDKMLVFYFFGGAKYSPDQRTQFAAELMPVLTALHQL